MNDPAHSPSLDLGAPAPRDAGGPPTPAEAVAHCHAWLRDHAAEAEALLERLYRDQEAQGILFAGQPIPTFLRPCFLDAAQHARVAHAAELLLSCAERVIAALPQSEELRRILCLEPEEEALACHPTGLTRQIHVARPDTLLQGAELAFIELNADSPAGVAWTDLREALFLELPFLRDAPFAPHLIASQCRALLARAMREAYREFGLAEPLSVAIVDWRDVKTRCEFQAVQQFFEQEGLPTVIADPRDLELRGERLYAAGTPVTLVYRRVIIRELLARQDEPGVRDFLRAFRDHRVCVVNPFGAKVAGSKALFAVLTDERFAPLFTAAERGMIQQCVPFTRVLEAGRARLEGEEGDLFELARRHRVRLVLKPANGYGGRDVALGAETAPARWEAMLQEAALAPGAWIVQVAAAIPEEPLPVFAPDLAFPIHKLNLNPFVFGGRFAGALARAAQGSVINVSNGGGLVPVFGLGEGPASTASR